MVKSRSQSKSQKPKIKESKSKQITKDKNESISTSQASSKHKKASSKQDIKEVKSAIAHDYSISFEAGTYKVKMHQNYQIKEGHKLYKDVNNLFLLFIQKQQKRCHKTHNVIPYSNFPVFEFKLRGQQPKQLKCSICQFEFEDRQNYEDELTQQSDQDIITLSCSHLIHRSCFTMLKGTNQWIKCPVCSSIYGLMIGDQPPGTMTWSVHGGTHCDGFTDVGTIVINYSMNSGKRGNISFSGTHRTAYLPDNKQGNEVLKLLKQAFDRKLIFTVGRSVTTGRDNQVVWNGIHHKTNTSGGSAYFGYPDQTYFKRLRLELAAKGIY